MGSPILPGVRVGPLDPDRTSQFGQIAAANSAKTLIRLHAQAMPAALQKALALKLDEERTKALQLEEVEAYLRDLKLPNGDPSLPKGATLVGASVKGERDRPQTLTFTFSTEDSGRTAKWFAPYDEDVLPESFAAGTERVQIAELKERGLVAPAILGGAASAPAPSKRGRAAEKSAGEDISADELTALREQAAEAEKLRERVEELEDELDGAADDEPGAGDGGDGEREPAAAQEPPLDDYDSLKGAQIVAIIRKDDTSDEERQAILDYERNHGARRGVISAAEAALGTRGAA